MDMKLKAAFDRLLAIGKRLRLMGVTQSSILYLFHSAPAIEDSFNQAIDDEVSGNQTSISIRCSSNHLDPYPDR
jgi:hypothetical protein